MPNLNLIEILNYVDPAFLSYGEWTSVGMALKHEGYTASDWDEWSRRDTKRYHAAECFKKWDTFNGTGTPVTAGTIVQMAKDHGWEPEQREAGHELDWNDVIGGGKDDLVIINKNWIEGKEVSSPDAWDPAQQLSKYLTVLFQSTENVGYVTDSWFDAEKAKHFPTKGNWDRTAGELIQQLGKCKGDIGKVIGDYKPEVGAWIRFNPLDGKGAKNENVTEFRYALVESDTMEIDKQNAIIRELELPVACLVHSGKKSLHAIVRVDAANYEEYRKRVDYLYNVCQKNGLKIDSQNRNPSRLSRMPGVMRNGQKQFLVDTNIGKESWDEWHEWIEGINDDLPEPESLDGIWDNLPELSPPLINNVLRQGHKMMIAGPSKAGKSFALIELCCAVAEGKRWLNWDCAQGKIMYVNLELDRASCLHRFKDVYTALGWAPKNVSNIDIWNLRGKSVPMDKLAPKLIRRAQKKNYIAVVIDPIYKVITGDENSADQMAHFCNQFDRICTDLGTAVIYCHHHSKGAQGGKKSMDRSSGSGVFARDPDVLLDLIELELTEAIIKQETNKAICKVCVDFCKTYVWDWDSEVSQDDVLSSKTMLDYCQKVLDTAQQEKLKTAVSEAISNVSSRSAWRVEGALREFPTFPPLNLWFDYPTHRVDDNGSLKDVEPDGEKPPWQRAMEKRKDPAIKRVEQHNETEIAFASLEMDGKQITVEDLANEMGVAKRTAWRRIKDHGGLSVEKVEGKESYVTRIIPVPNT